jgi:hypothetical protein
MVSKIVKAENIQSTLVTFVIGMDSFARHMLFEEPFFRKFLLTNITLVYLITSRFLGLGESFGAVLPLLTKVDMADVTFERVRSGRLKFTKRASMNFLFALWLFLFGLPFPLVPQHMVG